MRSEKDRVALQYLLCKTWHGYAKLVFLEPYEPSRFFGPGLGCRRWLCFTFLVFQPSPLSPRLPSVRFLPPARTSKPLHLWYFHFDFQRFNHQLIVCRLVTVICKFLNISCSTNYFVHVYGTEYYSSIRKLENVINSLVTKINYFEFVFKNVRAEFRILENQFSDLCRVKSCLNYQLCVSYYREINFCSRSFLVRLIQNVFAMICDEFDCSRGHESHLIEYGLQ